MANRKPPNSPAHQAAQRQAGPVSCGSLVTLCALAVLGFLIVPGCQRNQANSTSSASTQPAKPVDVSLTSPKAAARSVLNTLLAHRAARARGDREAAAVYAEQLRGLAARDVILRRYEAGARGASEDPNRLIAQFVQGWGPIIAYYADGLQLDQIKPVGPVVDQKQVNVHVWATSDRGDAVIRLECFRGADNLWRVASVDFPRRPALMPTTSPAP